VDPSHGRHRGVLIIQLPIEWHVRLHACFILWREGKGWSGNQNSRLLRDLTPRPMQDILSC